jgi:hypothetical protein
MKDGLIDIHEVVRLGVNTGVGYIVFCQSRATNYAFYEWFNQFILLQFVNGIKAAKHLGNDEITWFQSIRW